jgi:protein-S-isoprenylcysteine O-methyltransferase Ste14
LVKNDDDESIDANTPSLQIDQEEMDRHINVASDLRDQDRNLATLGSGATNSLATTTTASTATVNATKAERLNSWLDAEKVKQKVQKLSQNMKVAAKKIFNSQFGSRGEKYIVAQVLLIYSVSLGHIPLLKNFFHALFGPLLFAGGLGVTGLAIKQLNGSFTPFFSPVPSGSGGKVIMSGLYQYVRHPIYAGNVAAMVGWSVTTGSAMRLLLTLVYYLVVDRKSRREEEALMVEFGSEYGTYKAKVPNRFFPERSINDLLDRISNKSGKKELQSVKSEGDSIKSDGAEDVKKASEPKIDPKGSTNYPHGDNRQNKTKRHNSGLFP